MAGLIFEPKGEPYGSLEVAVWLLKVDFLAKLRGAAPGATELRFVHFWYRCEAC